MSMIKLCAIESNSNDDEIHLEEPFEDTNFPTWSNGAQIRSLKDMYIIETFQYDVLFQTLHFPGGTHQLRKSV